jgi:hypothetical protein
MPPRWASPIRILSTSSPWARISMSAETPRMSSPSTGTWCVRGSRWVSSRSYPSYDLEAVSNVGNVTSNTIQFTNPDTGIVATGNVTVGKTLTVEGFRITAQAEANDDLKLSHSRVPTPLKRSISRMLPILSLLHWCPPNWYEHR